MVQRSPQGHLAAGDELLSSYFTEMAAIPVFKPEEELERAIEIQTTEEALWAQLLGYTPVLSWICFLLEARGEPELSASLGPLRRAARDFMYRGDRPGRHEAFRRQQVRAGRVLRLADPDREALGALVDALKAADQEEGHLRFLSPEGHLRSLPPLIVDTKRGAWDSYLRKITTLFEQSHAMRNRFVKANLKLVVTISRRYYFGQLSFQDLIQEGNLGLIKAVGRYDPSRGFRFSTYAAWWIRHAVTRALSNKGRLVRLPVQFLGNRFKVARARRELVGQLGRPPTRDEICRCTGLELEKVEQLQETPSGFALSLDSALDGDELGRRFIDILHDPDAPLPVDEAMTSEIMERVDQVLNQLKPIEADVVRERFGLADGRGHTLEEVGQSHNLSRERIRQIQNRAIDKIRLRLGFI